MNEVNVTISSPILVIFLLRDGFIKDALCSVDFTGPDGVAYTSVSTERGSAGESVTVELTLNGAALLPSTTYYYQATIENGPLSVRTKGKFVIEENSFSMHLRICTFLSLMLFIP